jgi:uncharacterized protein YgbK (DUF1537 family)
MSTQPWPDASPLIAYYGDDLTGSTAVMEVTAFAGLETVLFLDAPSQERLADFSQARVIGIAGDARSRTPDWMDAHLPDYYSVLAQTKAPIIHYKICSTFDSSPEIGSIGKAADLATQKFAGPIPMLVGDLGMGRYQCFGHLFAMAQGQAYRIDRHPVMSRHPVTPMHEADLTRHLAKQTDLKIGLVDFVSMHKGLATKAFEAAVNEGARIIALDMLDSSSLVEAGRLIWGHNNQQRFCLGSQGLEAALVAYWRQQNWIEPAAPPAQAQACSQLLAVSGSVSSTTAAQIVHARAHGFATFALDLEKLGEEGLWSAMIDTLYDEALQALHKGQDVLIYSAEGPDDPAVAAFKKILDMRAFDFETLNIKIGQTLGILLDRLLSAHNMTRVVISGGDTSGRVARELGIDALTAFAPLVPGAPLCRAHGVASRNQGLELLLKGGQVGGPDIFMRAKTGGAYHDPV